MAAAQIIIAALKQASQKGRFAATNRQLEPFFGEPVELDENESPSRTGRTQAATRRGSVYRALQR
jgi:hypothetical protein